MRFSLFPQFGAMNSKPVFEAFEHSLRSAGHIVEHDSMHGDVAVIWSVLFHGRMAANRPIYEYYTRTGRKVIVLEVGGLQRNQSWKVAIDGINREAYFGEGSKSSVNNWLRNASKFRQKKFDLDLQPWRETANNKYILICTQHNKSHQWRSMPPVDQCLEEQIKQIRKHTSRDIKIRPHPRSPIDPSTIRQLNFNYKNVDLQYPKRYQQTYDEFDFDAALDGAHCVISHSSNPGLQAVVAGVPVFVGKESLAYDVSNKDYSRIENLHKPDRLIWFNNLLYTEYFIDEIADGLPLVRLLPRLEKLVLAQNT